MKNIDERITPKCFYVYMDTAEIVKCLSDEDSGKLFKMLYRYAIDGTYEKTDNPALSIAFTVFKKQIDNDFTKYEKKCSQNRLNGLKGGAPKRNQNRRKNNQLSTKQQPNDNQMTTICQPSDNQMSAQVKLSKDKLSKDNKNNNLSTSVDGQNAFDYQAVVNSFNSICVSLPKLQKLTDSRRKKIKGACKLLESTTFEDFFNIVEQSDFLTGRNGVWNGCSFDWCISPTNIVKILEGNYNNKSIKTAVNKTQPQTQTKAARLAIQPSYDIEELENQSYFDD